MQICSMSNLILRATTVMFVKQMDACTLNTLHQQFQSLGSGDAEIETLCSLVVHLVCQSGEGSYKLIRLLIDAASTTCTDPGMKGLDSKVKLIFMKILPSLSCDLQHLALSKGVSPLEDNVFKELELNYKELCDDLLNSESNEKKTWIHTLLVALCLHQHADCVMNQILTQSTTSSHIDSFIKLYNELFPILPGLLGDILKQSFTTLPLLPSKEATTLLTNLLHMSSYGLLPSAVYNF
uniref:Integrator complex subunit 5 C-terminal domain-containing protein n=1 Tax=Ciona savignyi TaxID=51511 RepID=H2YC74_CIOSA